MAKRGFWTKERDVPGEAAMEGAYESYRWLRLIHPPTASALALGASGGAYLAWTLLREHGALALVLGLIAGVVAGGILGVVVYWLLRLFSAIGQ